MDCNKTHTLLCVCICMYSAMHIFDVYSELRTQLLGKIVTCNNNKQIKRCIIFLVSWMEIMKKAAHREWVVNVVDCCRASLQELN